MAQSDHDKWTLINVITDIVINRLMGSNLPRLASLKLLFHT
jgi:hypothetical protein